GADGRDPLLSRQGRRVRRDGDDRRGTGEGGAARARARSRGGAHRRRRLSRARGGPAGPAARDPRVRQAACPGGSRGVGAGRGRGAHRRDRASRGAAVTELRYVYAVADAKAAPAIAAAGLRGIDGSRVEPIVRDPPLAATSVVTAAPGRAFLLSKRREEALREERRTRDAVLVEETAAGLADAAVKVYREALIDDSAVAAVARFSVLAVRSGEARLHDAVASLSSS